MNEILLAAQVSLNRDKVPLQLIQDVVTRWWSTQSMLERLINLQDPVKFALSGHRMNDLLTDSDWAGIKMVEEFLRPFAKIQKFLEGEKYITVSFVPVLVQTMRTAITNLCSTEYKELADKMLTYFESRLEMVLRTQFSIWRYFVAKGESELVLDRGSILLQLVIPEQKP